MIKEILKKNWIFILFIIIGCVCVLTMDTNLPMSIVPYPDSQMEVSANDEIIEQTWLSEVKEISGVSFVTIPNGDFSAELQMKILDGSTREVLASSLQTLDFERGNEKEITFLFPTIKKCQGEQYIFQLTCEADSPQSKLVIDSGTNYMGCTVNGVEQYQGIDFCVIFTKTNTLSWLFISFFPFIAITLLFMTIWEKKWEECVGLSTAVIIFVIYAMGLFGRLETGMTTVYILSVLALGFAIFLYNKKNMCMADLNSYGLIIYGIMVLLILINCKDARFARWDEFSHWGLAVKDMFYSDSFARHLDSTVMIKHYPPGTAILEYLFCYTNRLFSESFVYVGFQVLALNLLSAGLGICKNNKIGTIVPVVFSLLFTPLIFFYDAYNCLYTDSMLAFGIAYVLICYYTEKESKYSFCRILGGLLIVTLTKYTGIVLAGLLCMIIVGDFVYKQYKNKEWNFRKSSACISYIVFVVALFFSWQFYLSRPIQKNINLPEKQIEANVEVNTDMSTEVVASTTVNSGISLKNIVELFSGNAPEYRYQAIKNFFLHIFSENKYTVGAIVLPYMDITVMLLVIALGLAWKCKDMDDKNEMQAFAVLTFIVNLGYCAFQLITYLFTFSEQEALSSASYGRYLGSYLCGIIIAFNIISIKKMEKWDMKLRQRILMVISAILVTITPIEYFWIKNEEITLQDNFVYGYEDINNILQTGAKKGDKVYFVCNDTNGYAELQIKNAVVPMVTDYLTANIYASQESYEKQANLYGVRQSSTPRFVGTEQWGEKLRNYEYVVLFHPNEVFYEAYGNFFEEQSTIDDGTIYKVYQENGEVCLKYVGKTGILEFY